MALCRYLNVQNYSQLNVGPLCENKLVRELFKFPHNIQQSDLNKPADILGLVSSFT
jgi:hypothetical protein